jgi:hypothetical protein
MRTISNQKNDKACLITDEFGNVYFRSGNHVAVEPLTQQPQNKTIEGTDIDAVEFTADEDVKVDETIYVQDDNQIIYDMLVGPRPRNIVSRK